MTSEPFFKIKSNVFMQAGNSASDRRIELTISQEDRDKEAQKRLQASKWIQLVRNLSATKSPLDVLQSQSSLHMSLSVGQLPAGETTDRVDLNRNSSSNSRTFPANMPTSSDPPAVSQSVPCGSSFPLMTRHHPHHARFENVLEREMSGKGST